MLLIVLAYLGGALTILSPCILPVLPFVFSRADQPFVRSGLPLLAGMAITFAAVATLAAVGGGWVTQANQYGRWLAVALLGIFGLTLLLPSFAERLMRPLVSAGNRLSEFAQADGQQVGASSSFLLGIATGLLWAPCAGPILGLVLTGAALRGASVGTTLLLVAYAAGAASSLAFALLIGGRVFAAMKRSLGAGEWIRRGLGAAVFAGVVVIALGFDTKFLTQVSVASTAPLEQGLVDKLHPDVRKQPSRGGSIATTANPPMMIQRPADVQAQPSAEGIPPAITGNAPTMTQGQPETQTEDLPIEGEMPSLSGAVQWLNSPPLTPEALRGKVIVVDFWTYSCINCLRSIPYVRAWAEKYKDQGLVVIGVHTPEFAFEKNIDNVRHAVADLAITYPVAIDNDYAIWRAFDNQYWPAHYFIDAKGRIRHHHFGEGGYEESERVIQQLLAEAGKSGLPGKLVAVDAKGAEAPADMADVQSPGTYVGYDTAAHFISPGGPVQDAPHVYAAATPRLNEWALAGDWTIGGEHAVLNDKDGRILYPV